MQRDFIDIGAALEMPGGRELVPLINRLIAWARQVAVPVIFTHEMHRDDKSDYGIELEFFSPTSPLSIKSARSPMVSLHY